MPKRALIDQRPWLLASLIAGISYWFVIGSELPGLYQIAWKGAGVALLAVYALVRHPSADARMIALVMAFGALGDMVLEVNFQAGAFCCTDVGTGMAWAVADLPDSSTTSAKVARA